MSTMQLFCNDSATELQQPDASQFVRFFVHGKPEPGGSKRAFVLKDRYGNFVRRGSGPNAPLAINVTDDNPKARGWKESVRAAAVQHFPAPLDGPLAVLVVFHMPRPKGHYGSGRNTGKLKANAPAFHTSKPDATKLLRTTEDALTHIAWKDDAQIAVQGVRKVYSSDRVGAEITVACIKSIEFTP
jgi:Holliday junction resolvase RusA-like endonuclease